MGFRFGGIFVFLRSTLTHFKMCFGSNGETVVIRKREKPRYHRDVYVSRPETASYRRETITRRSTSAHRPSHDHHHHHHHDHGRSRSRDHYTAFDFCPQTVSRPPSSSPSRPWTQQIAQPIDGRASQSNRLQRLATARLTLEVACGRTLFGAGQL